MSETTDEIVWPGCPPGTEPIYNAERLWGYDIKLGGPATALALFYLVGLILLVQLALARNRNTYYMITLVISALAEGGAYSAAVHTARKSCEESLFDSFAAAQVLILLVPNFIEATMYTTCGKLSAFGNTPRHQCFMRPAFVTWFYTVSDIVTIIVQAIGIGIWVSSRSGDTIDQEQADVGAWIVVAGLIVQIISQSVFFLQALYIQAKQDQEFANRPETRALYFMIYWAWGFLEIRNIYRTVAFIQIAAGDETRGSGADSATEIQGAFFILETLMVLLSIIVFVVWPPSYFLPRASAKEAEKRDMWKEAHRGERDVEKKVEVENDVDTPAVVPDSLRNTVLVPFIKYPWLGRVF